MRAAAGAAAVAAGARRDAGDAAYQAAVDGFFPGLTAAQAARLFDCQPVLRDGGFLLRERYSVERSAPERLVVTPPRWVNSWAAPVVPAARLRAEGDMWRLFRNLCFPLEGRLENQRTFVPGCCPLIHFVRTTQWVNTLPYHDLDDVELAEELGEAKRQKRRTCDPRPFPRRTREARLRPLEVEAARKQADREAEVMLALRTIEERSQLAIVGMAPTEARALRARNVARHLLEGSKITPEEHVRYQLASWLANLMAAARTPRAEERVVSVISEEEFEGERALCRFTINNERLVYSHDGALLVKVLSHGAYRKNLVGELARASLLTAVCLVSPKRAPNTQALVGVGAVWVGAVSGLHALSLRHCCCFTQREFDVEGFAGPVEVFKTASGHAWNCASAYLERVDVGTHCAKLLRAVPWNAISMVGGKLPVGPFASVAKVLARSVEAVEKVSYRTLVGVVGATLTAAGAACLYGACVRGVSWKKLRGD